MKNLSQVQLVTLWSELERCLHRTNRYDSDTAEIYSSTLFTYVPCADLPEGSSLGKSARKERVELAEHSLVEVCELFMSQRSCLVTIDTLPPQKWSEGPGCWVRSHVKVIPKEEA